MTTAGGKGSMSGMAGMGGGASRGRKMARLPALNSASASVSTPCMHCVLACEVSDAKQVREGGVRGWVG